MMELRKDMSKKARYAERWRLDLSSRSMHRNARPTARIAFPAGA
jgi:hypothetical protein